MARRIQPKEATRATTGIACLTGTMATILIGSLYLTHDTGWPQFALSVYSAATVCAVGAAMLGYAVYQQYVVKCSLFADHDRGNGFDYRRTGQWAVVTGATDGIGKEYARQLAADYRMDVLLVGRNQDKLKAVAELIRRESGRRAVTVVADFAEDPMTRDGGPCAAVGTRDGPEDPDDVGGGPEDPDDVGGRPEDTDDVGNRCYCDGGVARPRRCTRWYPRLRAAVEGRSQRAGGVGVLINCAGVSYPHPEYFAGMRSTGRGPGSGSSAFDADYCDAADASVRCNVAAVVHTCRLVLPAMLARGRGLVVNVGSASASAPPGAPLMALYAATKKFLEKLSADLDDECVHLTRDRRQHSGGPGVRVQCVRPAYVDTAMLRSANPDIRASQTDGCEHGWWTVRSLVDAVERWLVPSARQWVRSALRHGGRLYADSTDGPANFTGYWPHTLLMYVAWLASALTPRRWYVDHVLIPAMLRYRAKAMAAMEHNGMLHDAPSEQVQVARS